MCQIRPVSAILSSTRYYFILLVFLSGPGTGTLGSYFSTVQVSCTWSLYQVLLGMYQVPVVIDPGKPKQESSAGTE